MFFSRRQEPQEFRSEMPEYDEDQDEYYGEEDDGDADDDAYDDEDDDGAGPAPSGSGNAVRTALMAIAGVGVVGLGGYYAATLLAPEAVDGIVNTFFGGGEQVAEAPPADPVAPPPGEAAPPPGGDARPADPAAAPGDAAPTQTADQPAEPGAVAPPAKQPPKPPEVAAPSPGPEGQKAGKASQEAGAGDWVQPDTVVPPAPTKATAKPKPPARTVKPRRPGASKVAGRKKPRVRGAVQRGRQHRQRHPAARTWHARYQAPAHARGTAWIQGQSAYIPWGGGSHAAPAHRPVPQRPSAARGRYGVQVGSFANASNARALVGQLRAQGIPAYVGHGVGMTRVYVGSYRNLRAAGAAVRQLQSQGIPAAVTRQ
ncbi:MAG: SPOR domain-containing protein [Candidatus Sericytochromatia bacterium]|nr:SPOR domain-containing protein [Candidatus Sericytochromatia bacterium]